MIQIFRVGPRTVRRKEVDCSMIKHFSNTFDKKLFFLFKKKSPNYRIGQLTNHLKGKYMSDTECVFDIPETYLLYWDIP